MRKIIFTTKQLGLTRGPLHETMILGKRLVSDSIVISIFLKLIVQSLICDSFDILQQNWTLEVFIITLLVVEDS